MDSSRTFRLMTAAVAASRSDCSAPPRAAAAEWAALRSRPAALSASDSPCSSQQRCRRVPQPRQGGCQPDAVGAQALPPCFQVNKLLLTELSHAQCSPAEHVQGRWATCRADSKNSVPWPCCWPDPAPAQPCPAAHPGTCKGRIPVSMCCVTRGCLADVWLWALMSVRPLNLHDALY